VTLKFIGERPNADVKQIEEALEAVRLETIREAPFRIRFRGAGFFPTAKAARVFWVGINPQPGLAQLAKRIDEALAELGIAEEKRGFNPHLTLARARGGSGAPGRQKGDRTNQQFVTLQQKLGKISSPDFGTMTAREFFLYRSQLSNKGSQYSKIARYGLLSAPSPSGC
jgi:2'-5' RNA ligase